MDEPARIGQAFAVVVVVFPACSAVFVPPAWSGVSVTVPEAGLVAGAEPGGGRER
ncbi:hypothetical protein [Actinoplanes sp. HUAS TT8]|uniref:hypothetical protein n=1 Tax=Actinoplanes sp. HUAS TT8 TaxID=3447453 RepID=UPI003F5240F8